MKKWESLNNITTYQKGSSFKLAYPDELLQQCAIFGLEATKSIGGTIANKSSSGVIFQTVSGYYKYEFSVYFTGFFVEILPFLALYTCIAFFIQSVVNNKFVGIMLVIIYFITNVAMGLFGYNHDLFLFGGSSLGTYSDMNGYGHLLTPYLFVKSYWFLFAILLLIIGSLVIV